MADKKLTKREFDAATNALYQGIERPFAARIDLGELERGGQRDYHTMKQSFEIAGYKTFGLPMELRGVVSLNKERDRIVLRASLRFTTERGSRYVEHAELWGEYDVYEGKWSLRWL